MEKVAKCIKETSNWPKLLAEHKFDNPKFSVKKFLEDLPASAPKLKALLDKINALDEQDMKKHGKLFKHFIYSDIKSPFGAKLIASALAASGFQHAYGLEKTGRGMSFVMKKKLEGAFATLTSVSFFEKNVGVNFRKDLLKVFNSRPDNIHGEKIRIIILDSGFREGVDLFDIKYVHLFEPIITRADEKQAIGRATRFCGQKGLTFDRKAGWPIYVYKYETEIPKRLQHSILSDNHKLGPFDSFFDLFMKFSNIDPKKINFANDIEPLVIMGAVDRYLNRNIHNFSIKTDDDVLYDVFSGGRELTKFQKMQKLIRSEYMDYAWPATKIENGCVAAVNKTSSDAVVEFSPTQNFVRNFFTTGCPYKGMLLMHSVGTGKTCSAIAVASSSFEKDGYTIIYVTRHTLKGDVWKNMFGQSCSILIQDMIRRGVPIPAAKARRAKLIDAWMEPMSYKQFSNMVSGKSQLYKDLVAKNGKADPLKKTLIIIDEAHKLYAPDVAGAEKPDVNAIRAALHKSYRESGKDSARLLLMTATPYTDNPLDMIKLLNMCRLDGLPETFDEFSNRFLDEHSGKFTEKGKWEFLDEITGYISYLNRERDVRSFSYPIVEHVRVPLSEYEFNTELKEVIGLHAEWKNYLDIVKDKSKELKQFKMEKTTEIEKDYYQNDILPIETKYLECVEESKKAELNNKRSLVEAQKLCKDTHIEPCKKSVKDALKEASTELKEWAKDKTKVECKRGDKECREAIKAELKNKLEKLKSDAAFDTKKCMDSPDLKKCLETAKKNAINKPKKSCDTLKQQYDQMKKSVRDIVEKRVETEMKLKNKSYQEYEEALKNKYKLLSEKEAEVLKKAKEDRSQQMKLETCLKTARVHPMYTKLMKGKFFSYMDNAAVIDENDEELVGTVGDVPSNVYMINGHGSENVEDFKDRFVMPEDKVLIAFPVCGRPNYLDRICEFTDFFQDPEYNKILLNPLVFKAKIESMLGYPIRIYLPGDKVPNMASNLFMNFNLKKTVIMKSGVFKLNKIPKINRDRFEETNDMRYSLGSKKCFKYTGVLDDPSYYDASVHHEVFKGNVYKPAAARESYDKLEHRMIKIKDIMEDVGPGIYYFTGCRSTNNIPLSRYEKILDNSAKQQEKKDRHLAIKGFHKKYIKGVTFDDEPGHSPSPELKRKKTPSPQKSPQKEEPTKTPPKPKIKPIPLKVLREIKKELTQMMKEPLGDRKKILKKVEEWIELLEKGVSGNPVLVTLIDFKTILNEDKSVKKSPVIVADKKGDVIKIFSAVKYTLKKKNYTLDKQLVGVLPKGISDNALKCDSDLILKKLQKVFKTGKSIKGVLPVSEEDWNNDASLFATVCQRVSKL